MYCYYKSRFISNRYKSFINSFSTMGNHTLSTRSCLPYLGRIQYDNLTVGPCIIYQQILIDAYIFSIIKCLVCIALWMQCDNEELLAMTRVLVGVEMLQCNRNPEHMEFSVPKLSTVCTVLYVCFLTVYCCPDGNKRSQRPLSFQSLFSSYHVSILYLIL